MKIRKRTAVLLAGLGLLYAGVAMAAGTQSAPGQRYVYFTVYSNLICRLAPRPDLLEARIDLDLQQVSARHALRALFAQAGQEYVNDGKLPEEKRITLQGKGMML